MTTLTLTIDGHTVEVPAGTTILEAARKASIYIPTLCHHPDLPPAEGSAAVPAVYQGTRKIENAQPGEGGQGCGVCVVEVEGAADLLGSCATPAEEGMVVVTSASASRRGAWKSSCRFYPGTVMPASPAPSRRAAAARSAPPTCRRTSAAVRGSVFASFRTSLTTSAFRPRRPSGRPPISPSSRATRCLSAITISASAARAVCGPAVICGGSRPSGSWSTPAAGFRWERWPIAWKPPGASSARPASKSARPAPSPIKA